MLVPRDFRRATLWLATPFVLAGLGIVLLAVGVIGSNQRLEAPRWVVAAAGLAFVLLGAALATGPTPGTPEAASAQTTWRTFLFGGAIVGLMAAIFDWIAFGPGERRFGGTLAVPFVAISGRGSELTGRILFGIGAVLLDGAFLWITIRGLRTLLGRDAGAQR